MLPDNVYERLSENFDWRISEDDLGYKKDQVINIGYMCSDRICSAGRSDKTALIYESFSGISKKYSFNDIRLLSNTFGTFLRSLGVINGDRVCLYMDKIPDLYCSFLGILKIGAIVQPLFSAFGDESLFVRLENAKSRVIITQIKHLSKVRKIVDRIPSLKNIIVVDNHDNLALKNKEINFFMEDDDPVESMDIFPTYAETPSVLHYTSGTTGQPKGVKHVHYSIISQYLTSKWILDLNDNDVYWCTADPGWVTGTSYGIIGPWSLGVTQCVFDAGFSAQNWYRFIDKHRVTVFYTSPTAIRSLMKAGEELSREFKLTSLRHLASVGEPLNPEAVRWAEKVFGLPFHDTYWQTETGSIMISNFPGMKIKPGSMGRPFPGITGLLLDPGNFQPLEKTGQTGLIAFKPDWPALMRGYWENDEKFREKFVNGWFLTGDRATIDSDGYFWFVGRDDDVINTGGHLISPFEIESVLIEHPAVAESAVVAKPDEIYMEVVKAFISLKPGYDHSQELELEIMNFIRKKLSPFAMPQEIEFLDKLPKTRSGKIMRRLLRAKEYGDKTGDISALDDD